MMARRAPLAAARVEEPMGRPRNRVRTPWPLALALVALWPLAAAAQGQSLVRGDEMRRDTTALPFAWNVTPRYPKLGVSAGVANRLSAFADVDAAFRRIEDTYRADGYSVQRARQARLGPVLTWTLTVELQRTFALAVDVASGTGSDGTWNSAGGLAIERWSPRPDAPVSAFAGGGGGGYSFQFARQYGAIITPIDSSGGYGTLDTVTLDGSGYYGTVLGGVLVKPPGTGVTIVGRVQYFGTGHVVAQTPRAGRVSIDASGTIAGVSLLYAF
jgi:hypothetical protein